MVGLRPVRGRHGREPSGQRVTRSRTGVLAVKFSLTSDLSRVPGNLTNETEGYLVWQTELYIEHVGDGRDWTDENDEDAHLRVRVGDNMPKYFLDMVTGNLKLLRACHGEASCITYR